MSARLAVLALLSVVATQAYSHEPADKRAEISAVPFVLGSRYGRSLPRDLALTPRNDRFFMGSRYGKRSGGPWAPPAAAALPALAPAGPAAPATATALWCEFTGVRPLYRCERRRRDAAAPPDEDRRGEDETADDQ